MTDDDAMRDFVQAIRHSAHRPSIRRPEPEQAEPVNMTDDDRRRDHLRRMLREALAPAKPEDTWRQRFPGRKALTNELLEQLEGK